MPNVDYALTKVHRIPFSYFQEDLIHNKVRLNYQYPLELHCESAGRGLINSHVLVCSSLVGIGTYLPSVHADITQPRVRDQVGLELGELTAVLLGGGQGALEVARHSLEKFNILYGPNWPALSVQWYLWVSTEGMFALSRTLHYRREERLQWELSLMPLSRSKVCA